MYCPLSSTTSSDVASSPRTWLDGLNSPLIQEEGQNKLLKLRFDVSQYQPEEIVVKTVDNKLLVSTLNPGLSFQCERSCFTQGQASLVLAGDCNLSAARQCDRFVMKAWIAPTGNVATRRKCPKPLPILTVTSRPLGIRWWIHPLSKENEIMTSAQGLN